MKRSSPQQYAVVVANLLNLLKPSFKNFTLNQLKLELQKKNCPYTAAIIPVLTSRGFIVKANKFYNFAISSDFVSSYFVEEIQNCQKVKHHLYKNKGNNSKSVAVVTPGKIEKNIVLSDKLPKEINITIGNITIIIKQ